MNGTKACNTLPRDQWIRFYSVLRKKQHAASWGFRADQGDPLAEKAKLIAAIAEHAEHGLVGLSVTQMDCDCSQWSTWFSIPATWVALERELRSIHDNAEGPVSWGLSEPPAQPEYHSRDLALEAFENGHPHVVYA